MMQRARILDPELSRQARQNAKRSAPSTLTLQYHALTPLSRFAAPTAKEFFAMEVCV
jgi:hypothetical protein